MNYTIASFVTLVLLSTTPEYANDQVHAMPPDEDVTNRISDEDPAITGRSPIRYEEGDFDPPEPGLVRGAEWRHVEYMGMKIAEYPGKVPDGASELEAKMIGDIRKWSTTIQRFVETRTLDDLLIAVNEGVSIYRDNEEHVIEEPGIDPHLSLLSGGIEVLTSSAILALTPHLEATGGELSSDNIERLLKMYANPRLVAKVEPWNDDDPWPVYSSGVFIVDPVAAVKAIKALDWDEAKKLTETFRGAERHFFSYTDQGRGLPVLKERYAVNRELIHAKFNEIKAWVEEQKDQAETED